MKTLMVAALVLALAASAFAVTPATDERGPYIKNLMSPTYRAPAVQAPRELTKRDVKKLEKTAELRADHLRIAEFYRAEASRLDTLGAAYENAAAKYGNGPYVKNLMPPSVSERYDFLARGFRKEARVNSARADAHDEMARAAAGL